MLAGSKHSPKTLTKMSISHQNISDNTRFLLSKAKKGKPGHSVSNETREKLRRILTGRKMSQEAIANMKRGIANSEKAKNKDYSFRRTDEWRARQSKKLKGKKFTDAHRAALAEAQQRRRVTEGCVERVTEYTTDWDEIRFNVYKRDNWICQECGIKTTNARPFSKTTICCHHIDYKKENNEESNLITLCSSCHSKTNFSREDWTKYFSEKVG